CLDELEIFTDERAPRNVALATAGAKSSASGTYPNSMIHRLEHLNDGRYGNSRSWISNEMGKGWVQVDFPRIERINRIVWGRDREERFKDRLPTVYRIEISTEPGKWSVVAASTDRTGYAENVATPQSSRDSPQRSALLQRRTNLQKRLNDLR